MAQSLPMGRLAVVSLSQCREYPTQPHSEESFQGKDMTAMGASSLVCTHQNTPTLAMKGKYSGPYLGVISVNL